MVEGWHGQPFEKLLGKTREYVEIVRKILAREEPVELRRASSTSCPTAGDAGLGLGRPLKLILHPCARDIPIYIGALGPKNIELTAEIADGWLPIFFAPRCFDDVFGESLAHGFAKAGGGKAPGNGFDVAPVVSVVVGDDVDAARLPVKPTDRALHRRHGRREEELLQPADPPLRLRGRGRGDPGRCSSPATREDAVAAVPDELIDDVALCGSPERIDSLLDALARQPGDDDDPRHRRARGAEDDGRDRAAP